MAESGGTHTYGPVASRRLGMSLGVDLVPFKRCDYDCVYCQLGRTTDKSMERKPFASPSAVARELAASLDRIEKPDYVTLAGSGEPTLNSGIGEVIDVIREICDIPVAVLTNGSLLWLPDVAQACRKADLVMPSLDAGDEEVFQRINRPCPGLSLEQVVSGLAGFRNLFRGDFMLEVLLVEGMNSSDGQVERIRECIDRIRPDEVHLNTVCRPPAEPFARPVSDERLEEIRRSLGPVTQVVGEPGVSGSSSMTEEAVLSLLGRRPCTAQQVAETFGAAAPESVKLLARLAARGVAFTRREKGQIYYAARPTDR
jgi:wyosine [tRNA(Phe)-imidazoG37] synthetase (radical SAM superfamily)